MSDIYLDPATNDIAIDNGEMRLCNSIAELTRQRIWISLVVNKGTWSFNINFGPPWLRNEYNDVQLVGKTPIGVVDGKVQQIILEREGVISLRSYTSTFNKITRELAIEFVVETSDGDIPVQSSIQL